MLTIMLHLQLLMLLVALSSCQNDIRKPPNILEPNSPKTIYNSGNDKVQLECKAEGKPDPTYKWTKDGYAIIPDAYIQFDSTSGTLTIPDFSKREEGTYMCIASNIFDNQDGRITASSFAPPIKLFQTRVEKFIDAPEKRLEVSEYEYALLRCDNKGEVVGSEINTNWYESENSKDVNLAGGRLFVDQNGDLHFSHTLRTDTSTGFIYLCGISSTTDKLIRLGNSNFLTVNAVTSPVAIKPLLQYNNSGVKGIRFGTARLECVFSGYDPNPPQIPITYWYDDSGREIYDDGKKYSLSADKRVLTITILQEEDERNYFCQARNSAGASFKMEVFLNVTSAPFFLPNGAPKDQTVVENVNVNFDCDARSAFNEAPPSSPIWYINGLKMGQHTDPAKFQLSNGNKSLSVLKVKKATDILCVQCKVTNSEGTTWADACLNVILPITVTKQPLATQVIDYGDFIDLTVLATTDPAMCLSYRWVVNGVIYLEQDLPFLSQDPVTMYEHIKTSELTETQYKSVLGTYRRYISHTYQTVIVETDVVQRNKSGTESVPCNAAEKMSVPTLVVGIMIGIATLLWVQSVIILTYFIIQRKKSCRKEIAVAV